MSKADARISAEFINPTIQICLVLNTKWLGHKEVKHREKWKLNLSERLEELYGTKTAGKYAYLSNSTIMSPKIPKKVALIAFGIGNQRWCTAPA